MTQFHALPMLEKTACYKTQVEKVQVSSKKGGETPQTVKSIKTQKLQNFTKLKIWT